jgi:nucleoid DNA-binding protein
MRKPEMARRLARRSGVSAAQAADRLDRAVYQILEKLRRGQEAPLPGLGKFRIGADGKIRFQRSGKVRFQREDAASDE